MSIECRRYLRASNATSPLVLILHQSEHVVHTAKYSYLKVKQNEVHCNFCNYSRCCRCFIKRIDERWIFDFLWSASILVYSFHLTSSQQERSAHCLFQTELELYLVTLISPAGSSIQQRDSAKSSFTEDAVATKTDSILKRNANRCAKYN